MKYFVILAFILVITVAFDTGIAQLEDAESVDATIDGSPGAVIDVTVGNDVSILRNVVRNIGRPVYFAIPGRRWSIVRNVSLIARLYDEENLILQK